MKINTKINWKQKLTSRKLWMSLAGFISMLVVAFGGTVDQSAQTAAIIMAGATVIGYVLGEGLVDKGRETSKTEDDKYFIEP